MAQESTAPKIILAGGESLVFGTFGAMMMLLLAFFFFPDKLKKFAIAGLIIGGAYGLWAGYQDATKK